uniref:Uncharacterized protein n=1 Tax=Arundo donax TaxID=35708 RepID=A0A0A9E1H6_ARUDO
MLRFIRKKYFCVGGIFMFLYFFLQMHHRISTTLDLILILLKKGVGGPCTFQLSNANPLTCYGMLICLERKLLTMFVLISKLLMLSRL